MAIGIWGNHKWGIAKGPIGRPDGRPENEGSIVEESGWVNGCIWNMGGPLLSQAISALDCVSAITTGGSKPNDWKSAYGTGGFS
ncbi:hypothetical protein E3N88_04642 [Mikania micrantha]|uniref:Uncharacterized protein n=1 Tax=Mikania micrantha TaxID=192012 RepID=A0A5N6PV10_9ASTR|nr:hypothetical protein E3N88_04642 [Mikania micrantha]